jgi:hypothetical protein
LGETPFGARIRRGEQEELVGRRFDQAAKQYRAAFAESRLPGEKAYAGLLVARSEQKAGRQAEARAQYQADLRSPPDLRDEYGMPLALYAAAALMGWGADRGEIVPLLGRLGPAVLAMIRDLAGKGGSLAAAAASS